MPQGKNTKNDGKSPLLKIILSGDSSMALNMPKMILRGDKPIFQNRLMNNCVIFKYPNFDMAVEDKDFLGGDGFDKADNISKPLETAIYIPSDHRDLSQGGSAVYLRQYDFSALMKEIFGIDINAATQDIHNDISILRIIDQVPSLDPYLLRTVLTSYGYKMPDTAFQATEQDDRRIRLRIESKIAPILTKAVHVEGSGTISIQQKQRFLKVLWNPDLPEADIFINSFGIESTQTNAIFTAWKGITFYQIQFEDIAPSLRKVFDYMRSEQSVPFDRRLYTKNDLEFLKGKISLCRDNITNIVNKCRDIFYAYDNAYQEFIEKNDPANFRNFLMDASQHYWSLGYSIIACKHTFERINQYTSLEYPRSLRYEAIDRMIDEINIIFSRRNDINPAELAQ